MPERVGLTRSCYSGHPTFVEIKIIMILHVHVHDASTPKTMIDILEKMIRTFMFLYIHVCVCLLYHLGYSKVSISHTRNNILLST